MNTSRTDRVVQENGTTQDELFRSLSGKYDLVLDDISLEGRSFSLYRIRDTNALIDSLTAADLADDDRFPYWAVLWEASIALARWCLSSPAVPGANVLELGCGLGLSGIAAATAGAVVTMTDYDDDALRCARLNTQRNLSPDCQSRVEIGRLDWRGPALAKKFDLVLGADIVYERRLFRPLLHQLRSAVRVGGKIMLADPDRSMGRAFLAMAEEEGFSVRLVPHEQDDRDGAHRVVLAELEERR